jgi:hypothetical protein
MMARNDISLRLYLVAYTHSKWNKKLLIVQRKKILHKSELASQQTSCAQWLQECWQSYVVLQVIQMQNITGGTTPFLIYSSNLQEQENYSQIRLL